MKVFSRKSFNKENEIDVTPAEYLEVMFANVEDGILNMAIKEDDVRVELAEDETSATYICKYTIDMAKVCVKDMIDAVCSLIADFKQIAKKGGFNVADITAKTIIDVTDKEAKTILGERLYAIWAKYVHKIENKSEENIYSNYAARIGGKVCSATVFNRAYRLVRMFELGAPDCVVLNEGCNFAAAYALNICAINEEFIDC